MIVHWGLRCTCQNIVMRLHHYFNQLGLFHLVKSLSTFKTQCLVNGNETIIFLFHFLSFRIVDDKQWKCIAIVLVRGIKSLSLEFLHLVFVVIADLSTENFLKQVFQWKSSLELYNWKHADQNCHSRNN